MPDSKPTSEARQEIPSEPSEPEPQTRCHMCESDSHYTGRGASAQYAGPLQRYTVVKRGLRDSLSFTPIEEIWMHRPCVADFLATDEAQGKLGVVAEYEDET